MGFSNSIPEIRSLGRFMQFFAQPTSMMTFLSGNRMLAVLPVEKEEIVSAPEDIPIPDEGEIYPNREIPQEEEYLPDEKEVPVEEPPKEIEDDPYFPRKGDGLPPKKEGEFPKTDPV